MVQARHRLLPMISSPTTIPRGVRPHPTWTPRTCERCGRAARPFLKYPDAQYGVWLWRCERHARQPRPAELPVRLPTAWLAHLQKRS